MVNATRFLRCTQALILPTSFSIYITQVVSTGHLFPFLAVVPVTLSAIYALSVLRKDESNTFLHPSWDGCLGMLHFCALFPSFVGILSHVDYGWKGRFGQSDAAIAAGSFCIFFTFIDLFIHLWFWAKLVLSHRRNKSCPNCGKGYTQVNVAGYSPVQQTENDEEAAGLFTDVEHGVVDQDAKPINNPTVDDMYGSQ